MVEYANPHRLHPVQKVFERLTIMLRMVIVGRKMKKAQTYV
jgi:hypothetical protein